MAAVLIFLATTANAASCFLLLAWMKAWRDAQRASDQLAKRLAERDLKPLEIKSELDLRDRRYRRFWGTVIVLCLTQLTSVVALWALRTNR